MTGTPTTGRQTIANVALALRNNPGLINAAPAGGAAAGGVAPPKTWKQMLAQAENATESIQREHEHNAAEIFESRSRATAAAASSPAIDTQQQPRAVGRSEKDEVRAMAVVSELLDSEDKYRLDLGRTLEFLSSLVGVFVDSANEYRTMQSFVANLAHLEELHAELGQCLEAIVDGDGGRAPPAAHDADEGDAAAGVLAGGAASASSSAPARASLQQVAATFSRFIASAPSFDMCYATHADTYEGVLDVLRSEREEEGTPR